MDLLEAWRDVRRSHGDDIAQQSIYETYKHQKINGPRYFLAVVKNKRKNRYNDGSERHKGQDGLIVGVQYSALPLDIVALVTPKAPDPADIVEWKEEARKLPKHRFRQFMKSGWKPPTPVVRCYYCHETNVVKYGKGRNKVQRYHCKSASCGKVFEADQQALLSQGRYTSEKP